MKSRQRESSAARAFRYAPHAKGKALVGVAAVVAAGAFAFLVFGPAADQRALEMAGYLAPAAFAATGASEQMPPERLAGTVPEPFRERH